MAPRSEHPSGFPLEPGWERDQPDPNWSAGQYHGMRMRPSGRQAAYGLHRLSRERDLLGHGGFHGLYGRGAGRYAADGTFRHPALEAEPQRGLRLPARGAAERATSEGARVEDGGVRGDNRYLRQYNAESAELRERPEGRAYGHAPAGGVDGRLTGKESRERGTDERGHAGYDPSVVAKDDSAGLDPRG
jgi:hypothetical protein